MELSPEDFEALDRASGRVAPADFLRLVALRVIAEVERPVAGGLMLQDRRL